MEKRPLRIRHARNRGDRLLFLSLLASVAIHVIAFCAWRAWPKPEREHVFILLDSGEEAVELQLGGAFEASGSRALPERVIEEQRFEPEDAVEETFEKPVRETPTDISRLELDEPRHGVEPLAPREDMRRENAGRARRAREDAVPEPPLLEAASAEIAAAFPGRREETAEEKRFEPLPAPGPAELEKSVITPDEPPPRPMERREEFETVAMKHRAPPLRRRTPENRRAEKLAEVVPETPAMPQPEAPAMVLGGSSQSRGVRHRAIPSSGFSVHYPDGARRRGETGAALVHAEINPQGRCLSAQVLRSSGFPDLDAAALETVRDARYQPGSIDGVAVQTEEQFEVVFTLN